MRTVSSGVRSSRPRMFLPSSSKYWASVMPGPWKRVEARGAALGLDLGEQQVAVGDGAARGRDLAVEHHGEAVAGLDVAAEVELVLEQLGDLGGHFRGDAGLLGGGVERAFHLAGGHHRLVDDLLFHLAHLQGAVEGARQVDLHGRAGAQRQAHQLGLALLAQGLGDVGLEGHAGLDVHGVEGLAQDGDGLLRLVLADAGAAHGGLERLAGRHLDDHADRRGQARVQLGPASAARPRRRRRRRRSGRAWRRGAALASQARRRSGRQARLPWAGPGGWPPAGAGRTLALSPRTQDRPDFQTAILPLRRKETDGPRLPKVQKGPPKTGRAR